MIVDWRKLKPRERWILAAFIGILALVGYLRMFYEPLARQIAANRSVTRRAQVQLKELQQKFPPVGQQSEMIRRLEMERDQTLGRIQKLEKEVPSKANVSQLVGEVTRLAKEIKLISLKQKILKDKGYSRVYLEVRFAGAYLAVVRYVTAVESISPFLRVEELEIAEPRGKETDGAPPVRMVVSCLLGEMSTEQVLKAKEITQSTGPQRDILVSGARPVAALDEKDFVLEGITFHADTPTAIINGEVYRTDAEVGGFRLKKIMPDGVLLTDGIEDHLLSLKR